MNKIKTSLLNYPLRFSIIIFIIFVLILSFLDYVYYVFYNQTIFKDILVEAHGILFDIVIFNILFFVYESARKKRADIERHKEDIADLRGKWAFKDKETAANNIEVASKIASRLKKLLSLNVCKDLDLNYCYLAEQTFLGIKVSNFEFKSSNLDRITFSYSTIHNSDFEGSSLVNASFDYADISGCKFSKEAVLDGSSFQAAKIEYVQVDNSYFLDCDFSSVKLDLDSYKYKDERKEIIEKSYIKEADIKNNIITTVFSDAVLTNSRFDKAKFIEVKIFNINFSGSSFKGASFLHSNIMKTKFIMADCTGAVFDNCRLEEIEISNDTNFQEASFIGAVIKGVNFKKAKLKGAKFSINFKPELERQGVDITQLIFV